MSTLGDDDVVIYSSSRSSSPEPEEKNNLISTENLQDHDFAVEIRRLSRTVNEAHLREIFGKYGKVLKVEIIPCPQRKMTMGVAVVYFENSDGVQSCIDYLDQAQIDGSDIRVMPYDGRDLALRFSKQAQDFETAAKVQKEKVQKEKEIAKKNESDKLSVRVGKDELRIEARRDTEKRSVVPVRTVEKSGANSTLRVPSPERRLSVEPVEPAKRQPEPERKRSPERKKIAREKKITREKFTRTK